MLGSIISKLFLIVERENEWNKASIFYDSEEIDSISIWYIALTLYNHIMITTVVTQ